MPGTPLAPLPTTFAATREELHRVAEQVVAPARVAATGNEIALEAAPGGFGTPAFPDGGRVRVDGDELVVEEADGRERRTRLEVDPAAAQALGALYAFAWEVLAALRDEAPDGADVSELHLWPEHFDVAFEQGSDAEGRRAGYGVSPGDADHPEPYLYVGPWAEPPAGPGWTATGFRGAELRYADLIAAPDQRAAAFAFFRDRRDTLLDGPPRA
jgi:hypothetical protein